LKFLVIAAIAATSCCASAARAQPDSANNYAQLNLGSGVAGHAHASASVTSFGVASDNIDVKAGFFGSGAVGHAFGNGFAVEGEAYYAQNHADTDDVGGFSKTQSYGALANLIYAITQVGPVVPYVGAGVGYGHAKYTLLGDSSGDSGVVWQLRAGFGGDLSPTLRWDFGYRYLSEPKFSASQTRVSSAGVSTTKFDVQTRVHVLTVGLRQRF
jgi:OOP family OmpA-OmpF porin